MGLPRFSCTFAHTGTYGHECGAPAVYVRKGQSDLTDTGIYWVRRCARCADIKGGENTGLALPIPFIPALHGNVFIRHYSLI